MKKLILTLSFIVICLSSYAGANISQENWRWRNDDGNESNATWKATENTSITISDLNSLRLRVELNNNSDENKNLSPNLLYSLTSNGPWIPVNQIKGGRDFTLVKSDFVNYGDATTKQINNATNPFYVGKVITDGNNISSDQNLASKAKTEYEWVLKPNERITQNTTYYFKADVGDIKNYVQLKTSATLPVTRVVSNGSFENDLQNWTILNAGSGAATYGVITDDLHIHTGGKALKIAVTDKGNYADVKLTQNLNLQKAKTYLLRFWAFSEVNNSLIDVNIKTSATNDEYRCQIASRNKVTENGWQMYQYPFKATENGTILEFAFNSNGTYYIDDVEIIDEDNETIDVLSQYQWHHNREPYGWISADNDNSVLLPDGSVAWIFSDTFIGQNQPHTNVINGPISITNNMIVHERQGFPLKSINNQTSPQTLFSPGNGNIFWNSGGVVDDNKLKILLEEVGGNNNNDNEKRTFIGSVNLPDLTVSGLVQAPYFRTKANVNTIFQDGDYNYIYLGERVGTFEIYSKVARVSAGSLNATTPWEIFTNDNTWEVSNGKDATFDNGKRILTAQAGSVVKLGANSYALSAVPNLANEIAVWFSDKPEGPWINKTVIDRFLSEEGLLAYQGHIDKGSGENGIYTLSYSVYPFVDDPIARQVADKGSYIPYFVKANLNALSPYGAGSLPVSLTNFTVKPDNDKVKLAWKTASEINNHKFVVERSDDNIKWNLLQNVLGQGTVNSTNSYLIYDEKPLKGINYYRLKQIDYDGKEVNLGVRFVNFSTTVQQDNISIYPNPVVSESIFINFSDTSYEKIECKLFDIKGQLQKTEILTGSATEFGSYEFMLPNNIQNGVYVLTINGADLIYTKKIVVSK